MPSKIVNTLLDTAGIFRAVLYRTFVERKWKPFQPMFNILQVKEGEEELFKSFLRKSLVVSLKYDTPLSLGAFETEESRIFIYVTHYASTGAYLKVMKGLLFGGESGMRAKATQKTSWTYCEPTNGPSLAAAQNVIMVGIKGDPSSFLGFMNRKGGSPLATVKKIKDVRGHSLSNYIFFTDSIEIRNGLQELKENGSDFITYNAKKINNG